MARHRRDQPPVDLETTPVMGVAEMERVMGWEKGTASVYLSRGKLPPPWAVLACGPIWLAGDIWAMAGRHDHQAARAIELSRMLHVSLPEGVVRRLATQGPMTC